MTAAADASSCAVLVRSGRRASAGGRVALYGCVPSRDAPPEVPAARRPAPARQSTSSQRSWPTSPIHRSPVDASRSENRHGLRRPYDPDLGPRAGRGRRTGCRAGSLYGERRPRRASDRCAGSCPAARRGSGRSGADRLRRRPVSYQSTRYRNPSGQRSRGTAARCDWVRSRGRRARCDGSRCRRCCRSS